MGEPRHRRRWRGLLLATSVVLALITSGKMAWALWTAAATAAPPGALSSGSLDLTAGPVTGQEQLVGSGGTWTFTDLALANAAPTESVARAIVLRSSGTGGIDVTAQIASANSALAPHLLVSTTTGGAATNTTTNGVRQGASSGTPAVTGQQVSTTPTTVLPSTTVAASSTLTLCILITLSPTAPATIQNASSGALTLTLAAIQEEAP